MDPVLLIPRRRWPRPDWWWRADSGISAADGAEVTSWLSHIPHASVDMADIGAGGTGPLFDADGIHGRGACAFDSDILVGTAPAYSKTNLTVMALLSWDGVSVGYPAAHWDYGTDQRAWAIRVWDGDLHVYISADGSNVNVKMYQTSSALVSASTPTVVGFRFDSGTLSLIVNGLIAVGETTKDTDAAVATLHTSTAAMSFGANLNSGVVATKFAGSMSDVAIYNRGLSESEIADTCSYINR